MVDFLQLSASTITLCSSFQCQIFYSVTLRCHRTQQEYKMDSVARVKDQISVHIQKNVI